MMIILLMEVVAIILFIIPKRYEGIGSRFPFSNKKQPLYRWWSLLNGIENWDHDNCVVIIIIVTWIFWSTMTHRIRNHIIYWPEPEESINTHRWYMDMRVWIESLYLCRLADSPLTLNQFFLLLWNTIPQFRWWAGELLWLWWTSIRITSSQSVPPFRTRGASSSSS